MSCETCNDIISGICKVCELVDGDKTIKTVSKCDLCHGVYMCKPCRANPLKRIEAYFKFKKP